MTKAAGQILQRLALRLSQHGTFWDGRNVVLMVVYKFAKNSSKCVLETSMFESA